MQLFSSHAPRKLRVSTLIFSRQIAWEVITSELGACFGRINSRRKKSSLLEVTCLLNSDEEQRDVSFGKADVLL